MVRSLADRTFQLRYKDSRDKTVYRVNEDFEDFRDMSYGGFHLNKRRTLVVVSDRAPVSQRMEDALNNGFQLKSNLTWEKLEEQRKLYQGENM